MLVKASKRAKIENITEKFFGFSDEDEYFRLDDDFLKAYYGRKPNFGFNGLGEFVYYRTYSRIKPDGSKETFPDTCKRVVEGCYEIQRRHQRRLHLPWDYDKAQYSAQEMFQLMWEFKFLPPGRGLWMMGTDFTWERGSAALCNCAYVSTYDKVESDPSEPFCFLMDMSMLGVGVGFDTKGAGRIKINKPANINSVYEIADSREGWVDSVRKLIQSYTIDTDLGSIDFDYSMIRPAGALINGFGGKASGPGILIKLHDLIRLHLDRKVGQYLTSVDITDIMNYIGVCVVAGNVRRSSELALGDANDIDYCDMKNATASLYPEDLDIWYRVTGRLYDKYGGNIHKYQATVDDFRIDPEWSDAPPFIEERLGPAIHTWNSLNSHRWASNNSIFAKVGMDYSKIAKCVSLNGDLGLLWLDNMRDYGRMIDGIQPGIDGRVGGVNPCFSGDMRLLTKDGYQSMFDLWVKGGKQEHKYGFSSDIMSLYGTLEIENDSGIVDATNVYRTGTDIDVYRVSFDDMTHIDATATHNFILFGSDDRVELKDLKIGDKIPSHWRVVTDPSELAAFSRVVSVEYLGKQDTYCLTEPATNRVVVEGHLVGQCAEQSLESYEACNLVEVFPTNHENADEYMRTLKFAYLYAKTVTLLPTHNPRTNQVMLRNRRIGVSHSGIVQAFEKFGRRAVLRDFCNAGYNEVKRWDSIYSEWLCVGKSIKYSSVKPSGTVSLLSGVTPGIHYPEAKTYWRHVRISKDSVLLKALKRAGYHIEPSINDSETMVIRFAITDESVRSVSEVSIWEQVQNLVDYQKYWADNQVSCTVKFKPEESREIVRILEAYEDQLKSISFLPLCNHGYRQAPYEPCTPEEVREYNSRLREVDYSDYIFEAVGDRYCTNDTCNII